MPFVTLIGNKSLFEDLVAQKPDKKPDKAILVDKQRLELLDCELFLSKEYSKILKIHQFSPKSGKNHHFMRKF